MRREPEVVFVGHEATRTGAPILLLHVVRWLAGNTDLKFRIVLLEGGPLVDDFKEVAPTKVLYLSNNVYLYTLLQRLLVHAGFERVANGLRGRRIRRRVRRSLRRASLIYANSGAAARIVHLVQPVDCPRIVHLHEMELGVRLAIGVGGVADDVIASASRVIVASNTVLDDLTTWHPIAATNCTVIHECVDVASVQAAGAEPNTTLRTLLGIPSGARVVVACGTLEWRKGPQLFMAVAARVARTFDGQVFFLWIGGHSSKYTRWEYELDSHRADLPDVSFIDSVPNAADHLGLADVFLLPSREDPFPLVAIEAAALGVPVVCFETVGTSELIRDDAGIAVPHLDVTAMADAVVDLLGDDDRRAKLGKTAAERAWEYDVGVIVPQISAVITKTLQCS